jgi:hypothetical protein
MKRLCILLCVVLCFIISCKTGPGPVQTGQTKPRQPAVTEKPHENTPKAVEKHDPAPSTPPVNAFDPSSISQKTKDNTKIEIQQLIQQLDAIIRAKNYNAWVSYLSPDYFAVISSAEYLDKISQSAILVKQKIVLKSAQDYFFNVVVPSRAYDRVDEIEFESPTRVKAFTVSAKGERLRLYDLERTGNEWKIIN